LAVGTAPATLTKPLNRYKEKFVIPFDNGAGPPGSPYRPAWIPVPARPDPITGPH
jgi:hypothetical protein